MMAALGTVPRGALAMMLVWIAGCVGPSIPIALDDDMDWGRTWAWNVPSEGSGVFIARVPIAEGKAPLMLNLQSEFVAPNQRGEFLYAEAYWAGASQGEYEARRYSYVPPGDTRIHVRILDTHVGPYDLPDIPLELGYPEDNDRPVSRPAGDGPWTLVVTGALVRDASHSRPLSVTLRVTSSENVVGRAEEEFQDGTARWLDLGSGDFDSPQSTRFRLGTVDGGAVTGSRTFATNGASLMVVDGWVEHLGPTGPATLDVVVRGSHQEFTASAGGASGRRGFSELILEPYGDTWTADVSFNGVGNLFIVHADTPSIGFRPR